MTAAIDVPLQRIEEKGTEVSSRNLSLSDLLAQLSHYNAIVRKDAYLGLLDLLSRFPYVFVREMSTIFSHIAEGAIDPEPPVRAAAYDLFAYILPAVTPAVIAPFIRLFMSYIAAAMSHLSAGIRRDSIR